MTFLNHNNNLCLDTLPFPSSTSCHCPDRVPSSELDKKFGKILNLKITSNNNPNNILTNLCSGLEKFLGFNSASKGYDGSGIVYSDLDRLCDGVMGFLSGVLSNIKDHLGQHNNEISNAIKSLETCKHGGKLGFNDAIGRVVEGVRGYNEKVRESNECAKTPIRTLMKYVKPGKGELNKGIDTLQVTEDPRQAEEQVSTAKALVATSLQKYKEYETQYRDVTQHINDLYLQCKTSIHNAHRVVSHETTRLGQLAGREATELEATEKVIRETLTALEAQVMGHIKREVNALVESLKGLIKNVILKDLTQISVNLKSHVKDLKKWIEEADEMLKKPIKDAELVEKNGLGFLYKDEIKRVERELSAWTGWIGTYRDDLHRMAADVSAKITELGKQFSEISGGTAPTSIDGILGKIRDKVRDIRADVGDNGNVADSIFQQWDLLKGKVSGFLKGVYDDHGVLGRKGELGEVVGGIKNYAERFKTKDIFGHIVNKWIKDNLDYNEVAKDFLKKYIETNGNEAKVTGKWDNAKKAFNSTGAKQIVDKISEEVKAKLNAEAFRAFVNLDTENIVNNVEKVKEGIFTFSSQLKQKLTEGQPGTGEEFVKGIAMAIEKDLGTYVTSSHLSPNSDLESAVKILLYGTFTTARQVYEELHELVEKSELGKRLKKAIATIGDINKQFDNTPNGSDDYGNLIDNTLTRVNQKIMTLHSSLNKATGQSGSRDNHAEKLDQAIAQVKTQAELLSAAETTVKLQGWSTKITSNLKKLIDTFAKSGKEVKEALQKLKDSHIANGKTGVADSLQAIHDNLNKLLTGPVTMAINDAEEIIGKDAPTLQAKYVEYLEESVGDEVKQATDKFTTHARNQYVSSVKSLLSDFSSKVYGDIKNLTVSINQDLSLGYKEFMDKFEKHFLKGDTSLEAITSLKATSTVGQKSAMSQATSKFNTAMKAFFDRWEKQTEFASDYKAITPAKEALRKLLAKLVQSQHFDHEFCNNLDALTDELDKFTPGKFGQPNTVLSQAFKEGFADLASVLGRAYVSVYDGGQGISKWLTKSDTQLTDEGRKGAKVCLTIIHLLGISLPMLRVNCKSLSGQQINRNGDLGKLFADEGYRVSDRGEQNGELQDQDWMKGDQVQKRLTWPISGVDNEHLKLCKPNDKHDKFSLIDIMACLVGHLVQYNDVCHIVPPSKGNAPCNVYQMLCWLDGLPHSPVYQDLIIDGFSGLFEKPGEQHKGAQSDDLPVIDENADTLDAYPKPITAETLRSNLQQVCAQSHNVLTSILGYGHAGGVYACEFTNNSQGLVYPNDKNALLCLLFDILKRVHQQCYFICQQLLHDKKLNGWRDCWYGYQVAGSTWQCNTLQCPEQRADQDHKQTCDQKCNQSAGCGLKSPLQSFLEDGLHGFLPHRVSSKGPKMSCSSCSKTPGMPCITPMGFADIGNMASHRRIGRHIYMVLTDFCSAEYSPLTKLCSQLTCLLSSAPTTLGDMFAFYYHFLNQWNRGSKGIRDKHREIAFGVAVSKANFKNPSTKLDITSMFKTNVHGFGHSASHFNGDLNTLVSCNPTATATSPCGSYLKPLNRDIRHMFAEDNADKYLSWIVYLTESFYKLLEQLYADCCNNCNKPGARCHGRSCDKECMMKARFVMNDTMPTHSQGCRSIVNCTMTLPTLRKYGMYFESKSDLNGKNIATKRTCEDFCKALAQVVKQGNALYVLVHKTIPEFLFTIREPFIWLNVALWSLSLFYLICVMVGRLDVLHIRSHLRIPSSHKITAQSLLAAAQVGRLAKISYLQP
ncbi:hypothetical protein, conserved [Babesia bigemina]|uniref:C3H1-type domain-containing protein n=1 Tax=Babesia bigemina TaxID=5866 RepID=A0A061BTB0_BABBI|nr:hypothetical protein, conserved [Babesia bigemina]CDR71749.1 hypothetical protein, conserved [Babesia bigemina]|eukprot:XP_012770694.1 hypothetical protein, conserved [Babesia bigemina]